MNSVILRNNVLQSLQHRGHVLQSVVVAKTDPGIQGKCFLENNSEDMIVCQRGSIVNDNLSEENLAANWNLTETWPSPSKANFGKLIA